MVEKDVTRFWSKVTKAEGCWQWGGSMSSKGYGRFVVKQKPLQAHRIAYELIVGAIPAGLVLDHICRNTACVNPSHLEPVTNRENVLRGIGPSAQAARRNHCNKGHEWTPENTRLDVDGARVCRTCDAEYQRRKTSSAEAKAAKSERFKRWWHERRKKA